MRIGVEAPLADPSPQFTSVFSPGPARLDIHSSPATQLLSIPSAISSLRADTLTSPSGGSELVRGSSTILTGGSDVIATVRDPRAPMATRFGLGFVRGLPRGTHFLLDHMPVRAWNAQLQLAYEVYVWSSFTSVVRVEGERTRHAAAA